MATNNPLVASSTPTTLVPTNRTTLAFPPQYKETSALIWFRLVFFGITTLASLLGNGIVIKSIMNIPYRKPFTYHMVTNLAIAELVSTVTIPFIQVYDLMNTWKFGEFMCQITSPGQMTSSLVVTWSLAIISLHRYRTLVSPNRGPLFLRNTPFLMFCMWVCAVAITFPSYMYSTLVKSPYESDRFWCVVLFPGDTLSTFPSPVYRRYLMVRFVINFLVPILIMILAYGAMGIKLKYHMATIRNTDADLSVTNITNPMRTSTEDVPGSNLNNIDDGPSLANICSSSFENQSCSQNEKQEPLNNTMITELQIAGSYTLHDNHNSAIPSLAEIKVGGNNSSSTSRDDVGQTLSTHSNLLIEFEQDLLKMIYVIVLVFVFFYFPYQVFFLLEYFGIVGVGWHYFHVTRRYIFLITCLPSALHPLCYGTMSKFYAKAFRNIVLCKWTRHFAQSAP